jgi:hypothetical protein
VPVASSSAAQGATRNWLHHVLSPRERGDGDQGAMERAVQFYRRNSGERANSSIPDDDDGPPPLVPVRPNPRSDNLDDDDRPHHHVPTGRSEPGSKRPRGGEEGVPTSVGPPPMALGQNDWKLWGTIYSCSLDTNRVAADHPHKEQANALYGTAYFRQSIRACDSSEAVAQARWRGQDSEARRGEGKMLAC